MRRMWAVAIFVLAGAVGAGVLTSCAAGGGSDDAADTESGSVTATSTTTTVPETTTTVPETTTTVPIADRYADIDAEIQRACNDAMKSGKPPVPVFDPAWDDISSPEKLAASVQQCVTIRTARERPTTTVAPTQPLVPQTTPPPAPAPAPAPSSTYYANCDAARAAGAAPVYRGDPGYGSHLDRDDDGVGCEN